MPAFELGGMTLGLREGVMGLIALVAAYMLFVLVRMLLLRNRPELSDKVAPLVPGSAAGRRAGRGRRKLGEGV